MSVEINPQPQSKHGETSQSGGSPGLLSRSEGWTHISLFVPTERQAVPQDQDVKVSVQAETKFGRTL